MLLEGVSIDPIAGAVSPSTGEYTKSLSVNNIFAGFTAAALQGDGGGGEVM